MGSVKSAKRARYGPIRLFKSAPTGLRIVFVVSFAGLVMVSWAYQRWIFDSPDPAETFAAIAQFAPGELEFPTAGDLSWERAKRGAHDRLAVNSQATDLYRSWAPFLRPTLPGGLCVEPGSEVTLPGAARLDDAVRDLAVARREGSATVALENELLGELEEFEASASDAEARFAFPYNRTLALLSADRHNRAARVLPGLDPYLDTLRMPSRSRGEAQRLQSVGGVGSMQVNRTLVGRYLAGHVHLARIDEGRDAIRWFRLAINAFNYLTAPAPATHATRTPAPGALEWMCQGSQATDTLTSLDAYSGLIAAYLASTGYRHPNRRSFVNELARSPRELENSDPFAPLILYGQSVAQGDASPTIPENFLWAASNVQRIRRLNDVDVSRRLEVARAVLALQIVSQPDWVQILTSRHGFDTCRALKRILEDLERFGRQLWSADIEDLTAIDPALATVSIYLAAAADQPCAGDPVQVTDAARSGLLRAGAPLLADGISGFFERRRQRLEERAATGAGALTVFDSVRAEMSDLAAGRPPPYTAVAFDYGQARVFVADWQRSVFRDAAMAMVREAGPAGSEIPGSRWMGRGDSPTPARAIFTPGR